MIVALSSGGLSLGAPFGRHVHGGRRSQGHHISAEPVEPVELVVVVGADDEQIVVGFRAEEAVIEMVDLKRLGRSTHCAPAWVGGEEGPAPGLPAG